MTTPPRRPRVDGAGESRPRGSSAHAGRHALVSVRVWRDQRSARQECALDDHAERRWDCSSFALDRLVQQWALSLNVRARAPGQRRFLEVHGLAFMGHRPSEGSVSALRACIDCGTPSRGRRCARHERVRERKRGSAAARGYGRSWREAAADAVRTHVELYGWTCPGFNRQAHASTDLTADHVDPLALGGTGDVIAVMCRSCNASKGAGRGEGSSREIVPGSRQIGRAHV